MYHVVLLVAHHVIDPADLDDDDNDSDTDTIHDAFTTCADTLAQHIVGKTCTHAYVMRMHMHMSIPRHVH